jgi:dienelactone hydrolase
MLPLVRPLHDAGFVVMVVALRGCGASAPAGETFGLLESNDVKAAVAVLRKRPFVDPNRIAIVGVGAGANACVLAASEDAGIKALVLDHPAQLGPAFNRGAIHGQNDVVLLQPSLSGGSVLIHHRDLYALFLFQLQGT